MSVYDQFRTDLNEATTAYRNDLPSAPLQRLDPTRSHETNVLGAMYYGKANPQSPGYAGRFSADTKELLNSRKSMLDRNSQNYAGRRSTGMSNLLGGYGRQMMKSGARSGDMSDIVSRYKSGLGGYTSQQNQGFREQAGRAMDKTYATDAARAKATRARSGVRGASATAQERNLNRDRRQDKRLFEQDLFVKNADEVQKRLGDYSDFTRDLETDEFDKQRLASGDYRDLLKDLEKGEYDKVQDALKEYQDFQQGAEKEYHGRGQEALGDYRDILTNIQDIERATNIFNIAQGEKEQGRDVGAIMGLINLFGNERNQAEQNAIMRQYG